MHESDNRHPSQREPDLITVMCNTIKHYAMLEAGDHVIVAVSGGADSVALLNALYNVMPEMKLQLTVAHLDHGLRGDAAKKESDFVKEIAAELNVPCICELMDVRAEKHASGDCLQEAARTARYRFFSEVLERCGAQKLALGHTMDDQAETVLIRLLRGASTRGLGGIPPVRSPIIRPLIKLRRASIEAFLQKRSIHFVPDTSCDEPQYMRNTIRHELIPLLTRQYNPRLIEALCTTADLARDDDAVLQDESARIADKIFEFKEDAIHIPMKHLEKHPQLAGRIVRRAFELFNGSCRGLTSLHTDSVLALSNSQGSDKQVSIASGVVVRREYNKLIMGHEHVPTNFHVQIDRLPADIRLPRSNIRVQIQTCTLSNDTALMRTNDSDTVHLAPGSINLPLIIRSWKPGDRMQPLGLKTEKKVKAFFAEQKIPVRLRKSIPLIESDGKIISVGTLRIAEHCRITLPCREIIAVTITNTDSP